ncbi:MAG: carboxypeptidase-like regulatory domain-containing protein, partial [Candidatus Sulfotelmatobacter sp.]
MRSSIRNRFFSLFPVFLLLSISSAWAQTGTTSLHGKVLDRTRAVVEGSSVTLANQTQGFSRAVTTPSTGEFEFLALPPGTYVLTVEKAGFKKYEQTNLQLLVNVPTSVNVVLQVGAPTTQIEVSGQAPVINTEDATMGIAFDENQVKELPLEGRNVPD